MRHVPEPFFVILLPDNPFLQHLMKRLPSSVDIALTAADAQASAIPTAHSFPVHSPLMYRAEFSITPNAPVTVADAIPAGT